MKIASYNVENLFDLKRSGYEYKEYIPYTHAGWNQRSYQKKLNNTARVIEDINADIIALQEIESKRALQDLRYTLKRRGLYYPYYAIANAKNTTVKVAVLSKIPFVYKKEIFVTNSYKLRNILEVKFKIAGEALYLFVNHWKSKAGPESMRLLSAKFLKKRIEQLPQDANIIITGDFNENFEEYKELKRHRRLNNTHGKTGLNHILGTINYTHNIKSKKEIHLNGGFYNLWYDLDDENIRYSYLYKNKKNTMDNMLINQKLLDNQGIDYIVGSFHPFRASYLFKKGRIYRWQMSRQRPRKHLAKGYSDHLPIVAVFSY